MKLDQFQPKRVHAAVGDLLQFQYTFQSFVGRDSALSTRPVTEVIDGGEAFIVEGGYRVAAPQIITVIPMHEPEPAGSDFD